MNFYMFNSCLLHIRVYYMGIYFYLMIAYILLLFVPGGKGRCRIYSYISSLFLSGRASHRTCTLHGAASRIASGSQGERAPTDIRFPNLVVD